MSDYNYAFSIAKIRSLEKKLVTKNQLERILDSENLNSFFEALNDTAYSKFFSSNNNPWEFQKIIDKELINAKKSLLKITPYPKELNWLWLKYDFLNIKYLIKSKLANSPYQKEAMNKLSSFDTDDIINYLDKKDSSKISKYYKKIIDYTLSLKEIEKNPYKIDLYLDNEYFKKLTYLKKEIKNKNLQNFIEVKIDLFNLKFFLRAKLLKKELNFIKQNINVSGIIDVKYLHELFSKNYSVFINHPKLFAYKKILNLSYEYLEKYKSLNMFEKLSYEYMVNLLWKSRLENLSPLPLVSYWLAKDNEAKLLRIIMIGKLNNINHAEIRLKLNKLYMEK